MIGMLTGNTGCDNQQPYCIFHFLMNEGEPCQAYMIQPMFSMRERNKNLFSQPAGVLL